MLENFEVFWERDLYTLYLGDKRSGTQNLTLVIEFFGIPVENTKDKKNIFAVAMLDINNKEDGKILYG